MVLLLIMVAILFKTHSLETNLDRYQDTICSDMSQTDKDTICRFLDLGIRYRLL